MATRKKTKKTLSQPGTRIFIPAHLDSVALVAQRGATDKEICEIYGITRKTLKTWRERYPSLDRTIETGRTLADSQVIAALHKRAIGGQYTETSTTVNPDSSVFERTTVKEVPPDISAIKYWLSNRSPGYWADKQQLQHTGKAGEPGIEIDVETRDQVMNSILNLITCKPDPE
jgi:transposase-like protein